MTGARFCEACGQAASPDARFCGACRRPFAVPEGAGVPAGPAAPPSSSVAAAPAGGPPPEVLLYELRPLVLQSFPELLFAVLTLGIGSIALLVRRLDNRYRVTNQRIELTKGVLDTKRRTVELHRVQDLELREPLFLRLRSAGDLVVRSMDVSEPEVVLHGIVGAAEIHEAVRAAVLEERRRHHVRVLEGI